MSNRTNNRRERQHREEQTFDEAMGLDVSGGCCDGLGDIIFDDDATAVTFSDDELLRLHLWGEEPRI